MPGEYIHYVHAYGRSFADGQGWAELYNGKQKMDRIISPATDRPLKYWHTFTIDTEKRMPKVVNSLSLHPPPS